MVREQAAIGAKHSIYAGTARTILARYIITMAKGGERDAKWLADSALLYLSQQKLTRTPPETV
jgi:hypothetical protein